MYLSKGYKNAGSEGNIHPNVYSRAINNSQIMETAQMATDWWMDKDVAIYIYIYIHIYSGILFSDQKWNLAICNNVDGTRV